jgi:hypothetical protein
MFHTIKRFSLISALGMSLMISTSYAVGENNSQMQEMQQLELKMQRDIETIRADQMRIQQERQELEKDRAEMMRLRERMMTERRDGMGRRENPANVQQQVPQQQPMQQNH